MVGTIIVAVAFVAVLVWQRKRLSRYSQQFDPDREYRAPGEDHPVPRDDGPSS